MNTSIAPKVEQARLKDPYATLQEIGDRFGRSRERIRQILHRAKLPTQALLRTHPCPNCGKPVLSSMQRLFCSVKCFYESHRMRMICSECGEEFSDLRSQMKPRIIRNKVGAFFCSKQCWGKYFGRNYGRNNKKPN